MRARTPLQRGCGVEVTGVRSTQNLDLVRRLGADHVIDYTVEDFTRGDTHHDLVLQLGGTYSPRAIPVS